MHSCQPLHRLICLCLLHIAWWPCGTSCSSGYASASPHPVTPPSACTDCMHTPPWSQVGRGVPQSAALTPVARTRARTRDSLRLDAPPTSPEPMMSSASCVRGFMTVARSGTHQSLLLCCCWRYRKYQQYLWRHPHNCMHLGRSSQRDGSPTAAVAYIELASSSSQH